MSKTAIFTCLGTSAALRSSALDPVYDVMQAGNQREAVMQDLIAMGLTRAQAREAHATHGRNAVARVTQQQTRAIEQLTQQREDALAELQRSGLSRAAARRAYDRLGHDAHNIMHRSAERLQAVIKGHAARRAKPVQPEVHLDVQETNATQPPVIDEDLSMPHMFVKDEQEQGDRWKAYVIEGSASGAMGRVQMIQIDGVPYAIKTNNQENGFAHSHNAELQKNKEIFERAAEAGLTQFAEDHFEKKELCYIKDQNGHERPALKSLRFQSKPTSLDPVDLMAQALLILARFRDLHASHGDTHGGNMMVHDGKLMLIDWGTAWTKRSSNMEGRYRKDMGDIGHDFRDGGELGGRAWMKNAPEQYNHVLQDLATQMSDQNWERFMRRPKPDLLDPRELLVQLYTDLSHAGCPDDKLVYVSNALRELGL